MSLLARAYQCAGRSEEAVRVSQRFAELAKGDQTEREGGVQADHLVREARKLAQDGRPNEALLKLKQALALDPDNDGAYTQLAKIQFSAGRYDIAREAAERALKHNPYQSDALYVLGRTLAKLGDYQGARDTLVQTTLVNPQDAEAFYVLGQIYDVLGEREEGRRGAREGSGPGSGERELRARVGAGEAIVWFRGPGAAALGAGRATPSSMLSRGIAPRESGARSGSPRQYMIVRVR